MEVCPQRVRSSEPGLGRGYQDKVTGLWRKSDHRGRAYHAQGQQVSQERSGGWKPGKGQHVRHTKQRRLRRAAREERKKKKRKGFLKRKECRTT